MTVPSIPAGSWTVDPTHTRIGFVARHMMVAKVRGWFKEFIAEVDVGENPLESTVSVEVQMDSIDTGNGDRDGHLRTNDFFDIAQYPTMKLVSTAFRANGDDYEMDADLTIKDVTRPVTFELEFDGIGTDPWGATRAGLSLSATINRKDWGIEWNAPLETGGVLVGDKVQLEIDVELVKS